MTQSKHTPTPWYIQEYTNYYGFSINHPEFGCVTERWEEIFKEERAEQMRANAAFIVRACNSHDALVEALKPFAQWAEGLAKVEQQDVFQYRTLDSDGVILWREVLADDFAAVLSALALAKGE